jgi:arginyl-tRNA synthetase
MRDFKNEIAALVAELPQIAEAGLTREDVYAQMETPSDEAKGDYAFPCFRLAKAFRKSPQQIAAELAGSGALGADFINQVVNENAYLNFFLNRKSVAEDTLAEALAKGGNFGSSDFGAGRTVIVEFSSPNIAKPFHIGHIRSTVIGNSIEKIYNFIGFNTVRINHLGDYGTQFGKMIVAYRRWGNEEDVRRDPIVTLLGYYRKFHEEAENDPTLEDEARETFAKLEQGGEEERELWQWFRDESLGEFNRVYKMLGIEFDSYAGESFYSDKMDRVTRELQEKGLLEESHGAQIVDLSAYNLSPALITKSDGSTLYITRDIAAAIYRKETYDFYKNVYVVASQQNLHFQQFIQIMELLDYEWARDCVHVPFGLVSLADGTMSTRAGRVVFLEDVLNRAVEQTRRIIVEKDVNTDNIDETARQVGIGAVVFNELSNNRIKDYVFNWDKILNFEGETGPYVQYSYARAASVLRKAEDAGVKLPDAESEFDGELLNSDASYSLIKLIAQLPAVILDAGEKFEPSIVTRHIVDVAQAFNKFYHEEHVLVENEAERDAKLVLVAAAKQALLNGLTLLGVEAPERM